MTFADPFLDLPLRQMPDELLAGRAQADSIDSFVELVRRYEGRVYNFLLRRVRLAADAEDLTQETFLNAWRKIGRYRSTWRFSTWLLTIASRLAIDHYRAAAHAERSLRDRAVSESSHAADRTSTASAVYAGRSLWALAEQVLSADQHSALWLYYAEDLTIKEIACVLRRSRVSVRVMLHRARELLARSADQPPQQSSAPSHPQRRSPSRRVHSSKEVCHVQLDE